ncbi:allantoicase [Oleiphilus messinensis]|uniref:Probable allantoicase n=1 Tax=Oleiphilus messinensis TaxID=141451 RepID=A0A1Y0IB23_9GAMM|nr:allantoicase [Oleiphilus messinensis]ARU57732.1 allantoicase [Oleiphilus messinensis]
MKQELTTQTRVAPRNRFEQQFTDLAAKRLGGETLHCTDDFFAEMENLLKPGRGVFIEDKYTDRGKWMDGWESRRRRFLPDGTTSDGREHDHCTIKLGAPGRIHGFNIDTHHFLGNSPQAASVEACSCVQGDPDESTVWQEILPKSALAQNAENLFDTSSDQVWTHVRLHIYPDGGVARFRVYGEVSLDWSQFVPGELIDLAYIKNGARPLICSDMFFSHMENLIMPGRGANMGDGWETKRRRPTGSATEDRANDWLILQLATPGTLQKVLVDTCHFKGNYPDSFAIEGAYLTETVAQDTTKLSQDAHQDALFNPELNQETVTTALEWHPVINRTPLKADREHLFIEDILNSDKPFTHIRLKMYPDGGISRLRLWGKPTNRHES